MNSYLFTAITCSLFWVPEKTWKNDHQFFKSLFRLLWHESQICSLFLRLENALVQPLQSIKGATESHFAHYSCVVIILLNAGLCRSAFSTISFGRLVFRLSVLTMFFVLNLMFWINLCYLLCNVILLCNRRVTRIFFMAGEFSWN